MQTHHFKVLDFKKIGQNEDPTSPKIISTHVTNRILWTT